MWEYEQQHEGSPTKKVWVYLQEKKASKVEEYKLIRDEFGHAPILETSVR